MTRASQSRGRTVGELFRGGVDVWYSEAHSLTHIYLFICAQFSLLYEVVREVVPL